jgi:hypothetical protein
MDPMPEAILQTREPEVQQEVIKAADILNTSKGKDYANNIRIF